MATLFGQRWEVKKDLGGGGQSWTYLVEDKGAGDGKQYVLKRLKNVDRLGRFRQEVETLQQLSHQHIIRVVDFDLDSETPYFVSEYCEGGDVQRAFEDHPLTYREALKLFIEVCEGVAEAHKAGVVHRDLKPANILLRTPDGPAVVADFGICYVDDGERQTLTAEAVGPRYYIAPELEDGRADEVDKKCDVYSLGKLLYWLLSGGRVFSREQHRDPKYDLVVVRNDPALEHVNRLLDRMIVHDREKRLADAAEVVSAAREVAQLLSGGYNPVSAKMPQRCMYCGIGQYDIRAKGMSGIENLGLARVGGQQDYRILVCNECGHIQYFTLQHARHKEWWAE
jgi:serine/threonine protein kinase